MRVSSELAVLLSRGLGYACLTGGVFDPVVLAAIHAIGYDRTFEEVARGTHAAVSSDKRRFRWHDVSVDIECALVSRPYGAFVDLGGLAKGAAADAALAELASHPGALVDLGGDICASGRPDDGDSWCIGLDEISGQTPDIILRLGDGGVATSSNARRRWINDGIDVPHVIDPRTGSPASSNALQCSAIADSAEHAEVAAKVGLINGPRSLSELDLVGCALGVRGVAWLTTHGDYASTQGWRDHALD